MEKEFKEFLEDIDDDTSFLMEILATIKMYRTLKLLKSCHHLVKSKKFHNRLDKFWKFLYEICEQMAKDDFKCLEMLLSEDVANEIVCPEILLVKAYLKKVFTQDNLTNLSTAFRSCRPDISKLLDDYYDSYDEEFYHVTTPTKMSPCGLAVIVNHVHFKSDNNNSFEPRKDSLLDVEALEKLWKKFGFEVSIHNDLTDDQVIELFECLAKKDHTSYDVFVTCYLSHGSEGVVYGSNCKPILISQLEDIIANKCITLIDKPKLFFIQACQGDLIQQGVFFKTVPLCPTQNSNDISTCQSNFYNSNPTPLSSHVLKVFSTIPGFLSYCEPNKNSWFIDALVTNINKYGHIRPIKEIMDKVIYQVSEQKGHFKGLNCKQTAIMYSTMCRKLLLKLCK